MIKTNFMRASNLEILNRWVFATDAMRQKNYVGEMISKEIVKNIVYI